MAQEDPGQPEGPDEGTPLDIGPGQVEEDVLGDQSVFFEPGTDPLDQLETPPEGHPEDAATTDAEAADAPDATAPAEQEPAPDADTPPKPWDGQHPDKLDVASMTDAQFVEWATANPAAARRYGLRQDHFSQKMEELARKSEAVEAERSALERLSAQQQTEQQSGTQPAPTKDTIARTQQSGMQYYRDLTEQLGREPNYVEFATYAAEQAAQAESQPLAQEVRETAANLQQRAQQEMASRIKREFEDLVEAVPQAATPERTQAIYDFLTENPALLQRSNSVKLAYNALYAEADAHAVQTGRGVARQQQGAASQQAPSLPPTGNEAAPQGAPSDFDAFYDNWAMPRARAGTLLDRMPRP